MIKKIFVVIICFNLVLLMSGCKGEKNNTDLSSKNQEPMMSEENNTDLSSKNQGPIMAKKNDLVQKYYAEYISAEDKKFLSNVKSKNENDKLFSELEKQYAETIERMNDEEINNIQSCEKDACLDSWACLDCFEGNPWFVLNSSYLANRYEKYISPAYKYWLDHQNNNRNWIRDAGLTISYEDLRKDIIDLEDFIQKYPDFIFRNQVEQTANGYMNVYLSGMDNTPIHEFGTYVMLDECKKSYEQFLKENTSSKYYDTVKDFYNQAKKHNFVIKGKWVEEFYKQYFRN